MDQLAAILQRFVEPKTFRYQLDVPATGWQTATPAEAGLAPDLADRLEETVRAGQAPNLHGLAVVRGGRLVLERYGTGDDFAWGRPLGRVAFEPHTLHDIRSATKSVVALLYGIALHAGKVPEPSEPLLRHLPEYADTGRTELTVAHALTMTLGLEWNEDVPYTGPANSEVAMELAPDRYRYLLERPRVEPPGTRWLYCGGASALLGRLIADSTGQPLPDFAHDALFGPLGIASVEWMAGHDGVASAASGLRLAPRDLARIGQCVLARGDWHGRQVIPAGWVDAALRPHVRIHDGFHYGYQWYLGATGQVRWVAGMGNGGQRLFVMPDLELVVTIAAGNYDTDDQSAVSSTIVDDVILASVRQ